jgi:hypothetical protein
MTIHGFPEKLAQSKRYANAPWWGEVYRAAFPDFLSMSEVIPDGRQAQLAGIDRVVILANGRCLLIDEKVREEVYDDFALEFWSDKRARKRGWVASDRMCDFFAYAFAPLQTCYLLPSQALRRAWGANCRAWVSIYGTRLAFSSDCGRRWQTEFCPVPISVVLGAISEALTVTWSGGA